MRAKNSDWVIGQALAGLFSQEYRDFELLVVDSGSTDRTLELVAQYPHRLIQIRPEEYFPGRVLNRAIEQTHTELIVFQNSDAVPLSPQTLGNLVAPFDDERVQAVVARQVPRPEADPWVRREYAQSFPAEGELPPWITLSLPMAAMRRSAWEQHRFYTDAWGSEDTEWGSWAKDNGLRIHYAKDALLMHSHNYTLKQLYGRRFIEGEADAFIYGRREPLARTGAKIAKWIARDAIECLAERDFADVLRVPFRQAVYHWAYFKGHHHGVHRKKNGITDARLGQEVALSTHESNIDPEGD